MVFERKPSGEAYGTEVVRRINDDTRRIRVLEQRLDIIDSKIKGIEERAIDEMNILKKGFDLLCTDVKEISKELKELRGEFLKINQNLEKTAKKHEVKELENLLDLYNPIKSGFITRNELERILEEKISKG
jgi:hypothetical protein